MIVSVDLTARPPELRLDEPDECKRFHVSATGTRDPVRLGRVLVDHAVGRADGVDAFIDVAAVRRLAAGRVRDGWEGEFATMLEYASTKGWLDASGKAIQAHVEWS